MVLCRILGQNETNYNMSTYQIKISRFNCFFFIIISFKQKLQQDTLKVISKFQRVLSKRFEEFRSGSWIRLPFQALVVLPITSHSLLNYYFSCLGITRLQLTLLYEAFFRTCSGKRHKIVQNVK